MLLLRKETLRDEKNEINISLGKECFQGGEGAMPDEKNEIIFLLKNNF